MTVTQTRRPVAASPPPGAEGTSARWLPVQRTTAGLIIGASALIQLLLAGEVIPPLAIVMAVFAIGIGVSFRRPRGGVIGIGALSLLALVLFLPSIVADLGKPASIASFLLAGVITVAAALSVTAGVMTLVRRNAVRPVCLAAGGAMAVMLVVAVSARVTLESTPAAGGDLRVVAQGIEYSPGSLRASAGALAIHVDNRDLVHHDLVIEALNVKLDVPANASRRVEFTAEPGTYEAVCTLPGHDRMVVTLVVE